MLNAIRTDLRLLLECLKCQMKSPASQKQALLTIVSICQQDGQNVEFLREIGGMTFIYNLSRSSEYSEVKETALFTLGSLAEHDESSKQSLCREEMFCGLADCMEQEVSLTLKRVAVYMLSALVSNNKRGQSLAKTSRCIDILLNLFRSTYPTAEGRYELLQLWTSVSSALCGCVNNPQNEENQCACMCMLPLVKVWLQQVSVFRAELAQPVCSFISMTVANNPCAQEYFASVGGLLTLSDTLSSVVTQCRENPAACKLAALITSTLSACITDNDALAPVLSELTLVPDLLLLLSNPDLSPRDQLVVVLTLGHCTEACVEHQSQLVQGGGLPVMISLLTEAGNEEVRKAAIFVLQTCKPLTGSVAGQSVESDLQRHRQSASEIQQRIQKLEKQQLLHIRRQIFKSVDEAMNPFQKGNADEHRLAENVRGRSVAGQSARRPSRYESEINNRGVEEMERGETDENHDRATHTTPPTENRDARSPDIFQHPAPMKRRQQIPFRYEDELSVCSELLDSEVERILFTPAASKPSRLRCAGCVSGVDEVNSRTVGVVLRSCRSQCEFHMVLQRAEDRLKRRLRISGVTHTHGHTPHCPFRDVCLSKTICKCMRERHTNRPTCRDSVRWISLTPLKTGETQGSGVENRPVSSLQTPGPSDGKQRSLGRHRGRRDYSGEELKYLSEGVRRFGHSWNTILWAYPFRQGRTNVDLARKYRKLQQGSALAPDLLTQECAEQRVR